MKLKLLPIATPHEQEEFEKSCYLATFRYYKDKGFPSDQGKFFRLIDNVGLTNENLQPLGWEIAGRNLVQIKGEVILA